jgi:hypothetical protein
MHGFAKTLSTERWYVGAFVISLKDGLSPDNLKKMESAGQRRNGSVISVSLGKARDTQCGMLEFRDSKGIPFGWSKALVEKVSTEDGHVLWSQESSRP